MFKRQNGTHWCPRTTDVDRCKRTVSSINRIKTGLKGSYSQTLLQQKHSQSTLEQVKEDGDDDDDETTSGSTSDPVILSEFSSPGKVSLMSSAMSLRLRSGTETD